MAQARPGLGKSAHNHAVHCRIGLAQAKLDGWSLPACPVLDASCLVVRLQRATGAHS